MNYKNEGIDTHTHDLIVFCANLPKILNIHIDARHLIAFFDWILVVLACNTHKGLLLGKAYLEAYLSEFKGQCYYNHD